MESKKRNKLGTILLCSLPPLSALVVTGVVIGTTKPVIAGLQIVEPDTAEGRHADSFTSSESWKKATDDKIKYTFEFPGEFKLTSTDVTLSDLKVSAKLTYTPAASNEPIVYDMEGKTIIVDQTNNTFKVSLSKEFKYEESVGGHMYDIPANTALTVSDLIISNTVDENTYKCSKEYTTTIVPSIIFDSEEPVQKLSLYMGIYRLSIFYPIANATNLDKFPTDWCSNFTLTYKDTEWVTLRPSGQWKSFEVENYQHASIYHQFFTTPTAGSITEIGYELRGTDNTTVLFKKEIGKGPAIKAKMPTE